MADSATVQPIHEDDKKNNSNAIAAASSLLTDLSFAGTSAGQQQPQPVNVTAINDSISSTSMYLDHTTITNTTANLIAVSPSSPVAAAAANSNTSSLLKFDSFSMEENMARKVETNDLFLLDDGEVVVNTSSTTTPSKSHNNSITPFNSPPGIPNNTSMVSSDSGGTGGDSSFLVLVPPSYVAAATGSPTHPVPMNSPPRGAAAGAAVVTPDKQHAAAGGGEVVVDTSAVQRQLVMDDYANSDLDISVASPGGAPATPQPAVPLSAETLAALSFVNSSASSPPGLVNTTFLSDATSAPSPANNNNNTTSQSQSSSSWFGNLWSSGRGMLSLSSATGGDEHERRMLDEEQLEARLQQHFASPAPANGEPPQDLRIRTDAMYLGDVVSVVSSCGRRSGMDGTLTRTNSARSMQTTDDFAMLDAVDADAATAIAANTNHGERHSSYRLVAATAAAAAATGAAATTPQKSNVSSLSPSKTQHSDDDAPNNNNNEPDGDDDGKSPRSADTSTSASATRSWWRRDKWFYMWVALFHIAAIGVVLCLVFVLRNNANASAATSSVSGGESSSIRDIPPVGGRGDNTASPTVAPPPDGSDAQPSPTNATANPSPTVVLTVPLPEEPTLSPAADGTIIDDPTEPLPIGDDLPTMMPSFAAATTPMEPVVSEGGTPPPTYEVNRTTRLGMILSVLSTVVDMGLLQDPSTPQGQAVEWLVNAPANVYNTPVMEDDGTTLDADAMSYLIERFGLLVMELSLTGTMNSNSNIVDVSMGFRRGLRRNDNGNSGRRRLQMALEDKDTCQWEGVTCQSDTSLSSSSEIPSRVEKIDWAGRSLSGFLPNEIGLFKYLYHLDLAENSIQGSLPDGLFNLADLENLFLQDNLLTGTLPERFADLKYLENVYLGRNRFTGPFPKGLGSPGLSATSARSMRYLSLYQNFLSGPIPDGLNLRQLYYLDLSHNRFNGTLPTEWADEAYGLTNIRLLYMENNEFQGDIPSNWPAIGNGRVETLHLANNQLTGRIPGGYYPRTFLQSLELQGNQFSGSMPSDVCSLIVFSPMEGELVNLRADCNVCTCEYSCGPDECG